VRHWLDRVSELARQVRQITEENVELAHVDQGYTGETAEEAAAEHGSNWKSSSIPTPNAASCCCRAGGW